MTEVASLYAYIRGDTSHLARSLNSANQQLSGFGRGVASAMGLGFITGGFMALGYGITSMVRGAVGELRNLASEALGVTAQYEALSISAQQLMATQILQAGVAGNMADALKLASEPAQELLRWEQQLAIESPFRLEDVSTVLNLAQAMGFSTSEAKRATQAFTDWSAAAGITGPNLRLVMMNMGQVAAMGKLTGREVRDFAMHGLPAIRILAEAFGVTTAEMSAMVEDGAVPAGKAIEALVAYMEQNYAGAAKNMATSWAGLTSSMSDVREQSLRLLSEGIFESVQPFAVQLIDVLTDPANMEQMQTIGQAIGWQFNAGLQSVVPTIKAAWAAGLGGMTQGLLGAIMGDEGVSATGLVVQLIGFAIKDTALLVSYVLDLGIVYEGLVGTVQPFFQFYATGIQVAWDYTKGLLGIVMDLAMSLALIGQRRFGEAWEAAMSAQGKLLSNNVNAVAQLAVAYGVAATSATTAYDTMMRRQAENHAAVAATNKAVDEQVAKYKLMAASQPVKPTGYRGMGDEDAEGLASAWTGNKQQAAANAALNTGRVLGNSAATGVADGLKSQKAKAAVDEYANFVKSSLSGAMQDSIGLGKIDGAGFMGMKPGEGGPFEALFRLQDVAMNLNKPDYKEWTDDKGVKHTAKESQEWAKMYGVNQEDAKRIVGKFQMGVFDEEVKQYVDKDKLKEIWGMKQMAEASQAALMEELGLAAKGKGGEVFKALTGTGGDAKEQQANVKPAVDNLVTSFNAQLTASGGDFEAMGGNLFDKVEKGFVKKAEQSRAFYVMVEGMVERIVEDEV